MRAGVATITVKGDVMGDLKLDARSIPFMQRLAVSPNGEANWQWIPPAGSKISMGEWEAMKSMVCDLIEANLVKEREYVTSSGQVIPDRITLQITDRGRNVLAEHAKMKLVAGKVENLTA